MNYTKYYYYSIIQEKTLIQSITHYPSIRQSIALTSCDQGFPEGRRHYMYRSIPGRHYYIPTVNYSPSRLGPGVALHHYTTYDREGHRTLYFSHYWSHKGIHLYPH